MRRFVFLVSLVVATVSLTSSLGVMASSSQPLRGQFTAHFGRGAGAPTGSCAPQTFCGLGILAGFGAATDTLTFTSFEPIDDTPCANVTFDEAIQLADGSGTLVISGEGTFCSPGGSDQAPSSPQDYGHPHTMSATFTVDSAASSGVFAGATGSGDKAVTIAGDVGNIRLGGRISLD